MSEPLTRNLPDVHDALQVAQAELRYHARRLRETAEASREQRARLTRVRTAATAMTTRERHAVKMADDYDRAAASVRRLLTHIAKRVDALRAPSDPTAISLHGHARAHVHDADDEPSPDVAVHDHPAVAPHGRGTLSEEE